MKLRIEKGRAAGTVAAPPSKSMAHRMLICAGLSGKPCIVHGISDSEDMLATMDCLRALGVKCDKVGDTVRVSGGIGKCEIAEADAGSEPDSLRISACCGAEANTGSDSAACGNQSTKLSCGAENDEQESKSDEKQARNCGTDAKSKSGGCVQRGTAAGEAAAGAAASPVTLPCRESGSTLRFFVPIALLTGRQTIFTGSERLMQRPQSVYETLCMDSGFSFERKEREILVQGKLTAGEYELRGDVSSQFVTGLLLALPLLEADSRIKLIPPVESRSYIDMTISALSAFGVTAVWEDERSIYIRGMQSYDADEVFVEGDYSNAAFFEAMNVLGADVKIENLREDSLQGDRVYRKLFEKLRNDAALAAHGIQSAASSSAYGTAAVAAAGAGALDISDCPDLGPVLMAVAAAIGGGRFTGTKRLKIKESDRGEAMARELRKLGVSVIVGENEISVGSEGLHMPTEPLSGHNDHRIVMSEAVLLTQTGGMIDGAEAVAKSFPDFFDRLTSLGIEVKKIED